MQTVIKTLIISLFTISSIGAMSQDIAPKIYLKNNYSDDIPSINTFEDYFTYWLVCMNESVPESLFLNAPLSKNFHQNCLSGEGFVRFYIDSTGRVDKNNIRFDGNINENLKKQMEEILLYSNNLWTPRTVNGKRYQSKNFILPLYFSDNSCKEKTAHSSESYEFLFNYIKLKVVTSNIGFYEFPDHYLLEPIKFSRQR
jgi:hypothetical protein